ncbi:MAG: CRISPR-associated endoribonuclease Cas6 [Candidatus Pacearchaeota archaeon]
MRTIIRLDVKKDYSYELKYHHKLQGFIYQLLKETPYKKLHDLKTYKFFCFSNIMPPIDSKSGEKRTLIISSPDVHFIDLIKQILENFKENKKEINIGEMLFTIENIKIKKIGKIKNCHLITGTPITLRIPRENYKKYGINSKYNYVFWRSKLPFEAFVKQLEDNLIKKYASFYKLKKSEINKIESETLPLFQQFIFKKEVCNHIIMKGKEVKIIGSLWEFIFQNLNEKQQELLRFSIDAGFGERNSLGFGFMNLK